ncbi:patatin-like phospholipase domain-containing protein 4 isoform X1 [Varanus komodoensis]|uniref:Patatin like phospholipase domain containing 4 n=1 Tax=Varanus komodoensis TaxID=61221 RepID=A0A8D2JAV2_VARKO|nr:patatin-like phospholipase domain-containing protein 4 isoform X1 [Varanus komodoensis]XP_044288453.1 patatin-like phospholipase domain-containing protein 4 isoform X1 [Varanus komodoensis]XP_044288462.1 patatin-like phospholipase domain-containing protein 4 isoform X1 [Varanus komodoensis]XP_044288471.1 patatin-like phospholipase domain-containing protein 4 isoform X1 [Varanus komodoensis]
MWANKYIYRFPRQWIYFRHTGLHSTLFLKIQKFGKDSDHCCILQAFRVFSTDRISQVQNERLIMDMATCANGKGGSIVDDKAFKEPHGGRQHEMEAKMKHLNLSFAACGFLGIYHLGAASALYRHGKKVLKVVKAFAGASAGSLIATVLLTVPENIEECTKITYEFAEETRKLYFGALTPGYDFMTKLRGCIDLILPSNAHEIAENRLFVSVTSTKNGKNHLLSNFASREDLVKALLASSFIPLYAGFSAVDYKGQKWVDGGLTNGLPILPCGRTVTVSPFCGRFDICPQEKGHMDIYAKVANQDIMLSTANFKRFQQALFPPSQEKMELLYQDGYEHTINFLLKENWFE